LVVVLPEKLTNAETISSDAVFKKSLTTTDLPTPVSPVIKTFLPALTKLLSKNLYFTVSLVGTKISKKLKFGSYLKVGI
jgi:hypothetical protein